MYLPLVPVSDKYNVRCIIVTR